MLTANRQLTSFHGGTRSPLFRSFPSFSSTLDSSELLRRELFGELPSWSSSRKGGRNSLEAPRAAADSTVVSSISFASVNREHVVPPTAADTPTYRVSSNYRGAQISRIAAWKSNFIFANGRHILVVFATAWHNTLTYSTEAPGAGIWHAVCGKIIIIFTRQMQCICLAIRTSCGHSA